MYITRRGKLCDKFRLLTKPHLYYICTSLASQYWPRLGGPKFELYHQGRWIEFRLELAQQVFIIFIIYKVPNLCPSTTVSFLNMVSQQQPVTLNTGPYRPLHAMFTYCMLVMIRLYSPWRVDIGICEIKYGKLKSKSKDHSMPSILYSLSRGSLPLFRFPFPSFFVVSKKTHSRCGNDSDPIQ